MRRIWTPSTANRSSAAPEAGVPAGVQVYEIDGPFFFGAAEKFKETIIELRRAPKVLVIRMRNVPAIDFLKTTWSATSTTPLTPRAPTWAWRPWLAPPLQPPRWRARIGAGSRARPVEPA
jgi:MFS superfamily sulfate permease-like transporter